MLELEQYAFVLHRRPYGEHQAIVDLLTENSGKISVIVTVGKSLKSNKSPLLQPFLPIKVFLKGGGELKRLSRVESVQKSYPLLGDHLYSGLYLNELLVKLLGKDVPCEALYQTYQESLHALSERSSIELILRTFERFLLEELGLSFDFEPAFLEKSAALYYVHEQGFVPAVNKLSLPCYDREHIKAIAQEDLSRKDVLLTYKLLMRQILNQLLGHKPLNSRKLFVRK